MPVTREEYIEQFGIDPETGLAPNAAPNEDGAVTRFAKDMAVGVATIPTDLYNFGPVVYKGAKALGRSYIDDTKFMDEFSKEMQIEDAQKNIQSHLQSVADQWSQQNPGVSQEQITAGLMEYQKSKQYEEFKMTQLAHAPRIAAQTRNTVRKLLGDEKTDDEHSWVDTAGEVIGGSLVPGVGWAGKAAQGIAATGRAGVKIAANPVVRGALKTAEAFTPLTMPYSGTNVALNAGVGVAADQAFRYVQGKPTAFTPNQEDSAGIGALAATGAGVLGMAAFIGAVKGRSAHALLNATPSPTATALDNSHVLDNRTSATAAPGETLIRGGDVAQRGPQPSLDSGVGGFVDKVEGAFIGREAPVYRAIQDLHGTSAAERFVDEYRSTAPAIMNDVLPAQAREATDAVFGTLSTMTPQNRRAAMVAWTAISNNATNRIKLAYAQRKELALTNKLARTNLTPARRANATNDLAAVRSDIQRFITDQRSARSRIPDITMQEENDFVQHFLNDMSPQMVKFRDEIKALNKKMLDVDVASGQLSRVAADEMHRTNPYFVHAMDDELKGKTGFARMWESANQGVNKALTRQSEGSGASTLHESPLRHLEKEIPPVKAAGAPETRITMQLDPLASAVKYVKQTYRSATYTSARNVAVNLLAWEDGLGVVKKPSRFQIDGHMRIVPNPYGGEWWSPSMLKDAGDAMREPGVVPVWQNGNMQLWEFGDIAIAKALRMEPVQLSGMMKFISMSTDIMKAFTTGRFAPWFAPLASQYNTFVTMLTRPANRAFGVGSYWAMRVLPEKFAKHTVGRLPDITQPITMPYHLTRAIVELQSYHLTQPIVRQLLKSTPFASLQQAVGAQQFSGMVRTMLKVAHWAEQSPTVLLYKAGATTGAQTINSIPEVRTAITQMSDHVPGVLKGAWQVYKDIIDAIYLADKRMYFTQNYALESLKYGKKNQPVPQHEIDRLVKETRVLAGDMTKIPASKFMQDMERTLPYLTQTKLGAHHLMTHMASKETMSYVIPRVMLMTNGIAASYYMMTYWNEESRKEYWERTAEYDRFKHVYIPTAKLATAFAQGITLPYSRDLYYKVPVPPDIAPIVAGMTAMWQMLGAIPADATPKPMTGDLFKVLTDNLTPAMPVLAQTALGAGGMKLDPQSSETRGGDWIRNMVPRFKSGPETEARTNLGQVSNSTALMMNGLLGATASYLVAGMDVFLHASKFKPNAGGGVSPRESYDFAKGLQAATNEVFQITKSKIPDVPLLWQGKEKYATATESWKYVAMDKRHIDDIVDMRDGKAGQRKRDLAGAAGGIAPQAMTNPVLAQLADAISAWQNPTGELGLLRKQYSELSVQNRSVQAQYNLPADARRERGNQIVKLMQDNMQQQYLATRNAEQAIAATYGQALAPMLNGRHITMETINSLMRESIGSK